MKTIFGIAVIMVLSVATHLTGQPIKMTIGQTGINPGTAPTPAALKADPAAFIDTTIIDQLLKEGYFKY